MNVQIRLICSDQTESSSTISSVSTEYSMYSLTSNG